MLGLATESTEVADDRFAISIETVGTKKIGWYLTKDQEASKALVHSREALPSRLVGDP